MKEKSLMEKIADFLEYLQETDFFPERRDEKNMKFKSKEQAERVINLCLGASYITPEKQRKSREIKDKTNAGALIHGFTFEEYRTYRITIEGIKFLEDFKRNKNQGERIDAQNYLTMGLFAVAFLQGLVSIIYYYFDLKNRGFLSDSVTFLVGSLILTVCIIITLIVWGAKSK